MKANSRLFFNRLFLGLGRGVGLGRSSRAQAWNDQLSLCLCLLIPSMLTSQSPQRPFSSFRSGTLAKICAFFTVFQMYKLPLKEPPEFYQPMQCICRKTTNVQILQFPPVDFLRPPWVIPAGSPDPRSTLQAPGQA